MEKFNKRWIRSITFGLTKLIRLLFKQEKKVSFRLVSVVKAGVFIESSSRHIANSPRKHFCLLILSGFKSGFVYFGKKNVICIKRVV